MRKIMALGLTVVLAFNLFIYEHHADTHLIADGEDFTLTTG